MFLHAEFEAGANVLIFVAADGVLCCPCLRAQGVSHEFSARKLPWTATPADVAAETRFVIVLLLCSYLV